MNDLVSYLKKHSAEIPKTESAPLGAKQNESLILTVIVLSASEATISIGYMGREFSIPKSEIQRITDAPDNTPNPFGYGRAAHIAVKKTATLAFEHHVPVADLERGQPFPSARPSAATPFTHSAYSPNETAWRQINGVPETPMYATGTASSLSSASTCAFGRQDDYGPDTPGSLDD